MNDSSELKYSTTLLDGVVKRTLEAANTDVARKLLSSSLIAPFNEIRDRYRVYAVCFCQDGNQLSQWRAYSKNATGYAVGFDKSWFLANSHKKTFHDPALIRAIYARGEQLEKARSLVQKCFEDTRGRLEALLDHEPQNEVRILGLFFGQVLEDAFSLLYSFKDPGFAEEREWRYVVPSIQADLDKVQFRELRGMIVPYIEVPSLPSEDGKRAPLPITRIIQGPLGDPELGERSLRLLLRKYGYDNVQIERANIPLRF
jgi:hypothetical protein